MDTADGAQEPERGAQGQGQRCGAGRRACVGLGERLGAGCALGWLACAIAGWNVAGGMHRRRHARETGGRMRESGTQAWWLAGGYGACGEHMVCAAGVGQAHGLAWG